jgi:hypothetical protein
MRKRRLRGELTAIALAVTVVAAGSYRIGQTVDQRRFNRYAEAVMRDILPLPSEMQVLKEWRACDMSAESSCIQSDSVELLIDDRNHASPPLAALRRHLERRGWREFDHVGYDDVFARLGPATLEVSPLRPLLELTGGGVTWPPVNEFLTTHSPDGVVYLSVTPGRYRAFPRYTPYPHPRPADWRARAEDFVGSWHVHGSRLEITSLSVGELVHSSQNCDAREAEALCVEVQRLSFSLSNGGTALIATVVSIVDGRGVAVVPSDGVRVGDIFRLEFEQPHLLKTIYVKPQRDLHGGNPYWCGDQLEAVYRRHCGA